MPFQLLVLVPSRELAVQVAGQMEQLFRRSTSAPPRLSLILSAVTPKATADPVDAAAAAQLQYGELLRQEPEVLVATPPALMRVLRVRDEESEAPGFGFDADADADGDGDGEGEGGGRRPSRRPRPSVLSLLLGANLDAVVLDEVDALRYLLKHYYHPLIHCKELHCLLLLIPFSIQ